MIVIATGTMGRTDHDDIFSDSGMAQIAGGSSAQIVKEQPGTLAASVAFAEASRKSRTGLPSERVKRQHLRAFPLRVDHCGDHGFAEAFHLLILRAELQQNKIDTRCLKPS